VPPAWFRFLTRPQLTANKVIDMPFSAFFRIVVLALCGGIAGGVLAATPASTKAAGEWKLRPMFSDPFAGPRYGEGIEEILWRDDGAGPMLYAAGDIDLVGSRRARDFIRWDGIRWIPMGFDPNNNMELGGGYLGIKSLVEHNDEMLAAGFNLIDGQGDEIRSIARWNGREWERLPGTELLANERVRSLQSDGVRLLVTGNFTSFGGTQSKGIALLENGTWMQLELPALNLTNPVLLGGEVLACASDQSLAKWVRRTSQGWTEMTGGPSWTCEQLTRFVAGDSMYVFEYYDGDAVRWDGQWHSIPNRPNYVSAMTTIGNDVLASVKSDWDVVPANHSIQRWDGQSWHLFSNQGVAGASGIRTFGEDIFFFGSSWWDLHDDHGIGPSMLVNWNPKAGLTNWNKMPLEPYSMKVFQGEVVAGTIQYSANGQYFGCIGKWNGNQWSPFGAGLPGCSYDGQAEVGVGSLEVHEGKLYAIKDFRLPGRNRDYELWRWEGSEWQKLTLPGLGRGSLKSTPLGLTYATYDGIFVRVGEHWQRLGPATNGFFTPIEWFEGELYAIARYGVNGSTVLAKRVGEGWVPAGPAQFQATSLTVHQAKLLVGGRDISGTSGHHKIVESDGTGWSTFRDLGVLSSEIGAMSSTEFGLVVVTDTPSLITDDSITELVGCTHAGSAFAFMGDVYINGLNERTSLPGCVFGELAETQTSLLVDSSRPQPNVPLIARVTVASAQYPPPQGIVAIDGMPAGSCTIELVADSATSSSGSCELHYNRNIDVELIAFFMGSAVSGGSAWNESKSLPVQLEITTSVFNDSFEAPSLANR
jgi:hypothetical protein